MTTPKKHILTSYDRLSDELLEEFNLAFPGGYETYANEVTKPNGEKFYAVRMECEDAVYLVRVELHADKWEDVDEEDEENDELEEELEEDEKGGMDVDMMDDVEEEEEEEQADCDADADDEETGDKHDDDDYDV